MADTKLTLKRAIRHPLAVLTAVVGLFGGIFHLPFIGELWAWLLANTSTLFTASAIAGGTIAPSIPWIPTDLLTTASLVFGSILVGKLVWSAGGALLERFKS